MTLGRCIAAWAAAAGLLLASCASPVPGADPRSDEPEHRVASTRAVVEAASYTEALARWHDPEDLNAWIGARFTYDRPRALQLSETQRLRGPTPPIHAPDAFFARPQGICVDLSRFAVETLQQVAPALKPRYLMIEFDPVSLSGQVLRRHWVAAFERDGALYVFADSKRPGHIAGPYPGVTAFAADYAQYRGRPIVAVKALASYQRRLKTRAPRHLRDDRS